jgi:hypothetical protein
MVLFKSFFQVAKAWKSISSESDLTAFLNRERAKAQSVAVSNSGAMTGSCDVRLDLLTYLLTTYTRKQGKNKIKIPTEQHICLQVF